MTGLRVPAAVELSFTQQQQSQGPTFSLDEVKEFKVKVPSFDSCRPPLSAILLFLFSSFLDSSHFPHFSSVICIVASGESSWKGQKRKPKAHRRDRGHNGLKKSYPALENGPSLSLLVFPLIIFFLLPFYPFLFLLFFLLPFILFFFFSFSFLFRLHDHYHV